VSDGAGLDASIETTEHICWEVWSLLAKVHLMLERVRDMAVPDLTSATIAGMVKALAPKEDGKDPMNVIVRRQVTTRSESVFTMLMTHGVECDFDKITSTYSKGKDGHDKSANDFIEDAQNMATRLALFLADRNAKRKAAHELKHNMKVVSSSKMTGSSS
jgi:hypothetical protein